MELRALARPGGKTSQALVDDREVAGLAQAVCELTEGAYGQTNMHIAGLGKQEWQAAFIQELSAHYCRLANSTTHVGRHPGTGVLWKQSANIVSDPTAVAADLEMLGSPRILAIWPLRSSPLKTDSSVESVFDVADKPNLAHYGLSL